MPKVPRDLSGRKLAYLLKKYDYEIKNETGSHLRLVSGVMGKEHKITIPDHQSIKIGTLNNILSGLAGYLKIEKKTLTEKLFGK